MASTDAEAELERFREQWRAEVARNRRPDGPDGASGEESRFQRAKDAGLSAPAAGPSTARRKDLIDFSEEVEPRAYHDLPDKEEILKLGSEGQSTERNPYKEPSSAIEHYERAVEKETQGQLGESVRHYRKAFKLDDGVHEAYKRKHFPPSSFKPKPSNPQPSNAAVTVPGTGHHSLHGSGNLSPSLKTLLEEFSQLRIEPAPPPTSASPQPPCPIANLPEEILTDILATLAVIDVASFARLAQVSKRLAYLVLTEDSVWKRVALGHEFGCAAMHYDFACDIDGDPLGANDEIAKYLDAYEEPDPEDPDDGPELPPTPEEREAAFLSTSEQLLHSSYASSWLQMFRSRPRLRFNGCYISTVNYARAGANSTNTLTWGAPVHVVTYFRYLRFFRDGTAISLLTTSEPGDVVHHLTQENLHHHHGGASSMLPSSVMKDALKGRWRLTGPLATSSGSSGEVEGDVLIETEGVVPKYTYHLHLALANAGKGARNNKLAWKGFWSYNRLTDDWAEFGLRNDRAFYWSRVKSFGMGMGL